MAPITVMASRVTLGSTQAIGSPRFLGPSFRARRPQPPRGSRWVLVPVASLSITGFTTSGRLADPNWRNEAESGSLDYGSRVRLPRLHELRYLHPRSVGYMSNGQFTWQAPFSSHDGPGLTWRTRVRGGRRDHAEKKKRAPRVEPGAPSSFFRAQTKWGRVSRLPRRP